jgi:hypothetical protein
VAVQVVTKAHGEVTDVQPVGSARTDAELALLLRAARELLHPGQGELDLGPVEEAAFTVADVANWTRREEVGLFRCLLAPTSSSSRWARRSLSPVARLRSEIPRRQRHERMLRIRAVSLGLW